MAEVDLWASGFVRGNSQSGDRFTKERMKDEVRIATSRSLTKALGEGGRKKINVSTSNKVNPAAMPKG